MFFHILNEISCTHYIYEINISSRCISNDYVGYDWSESYYLDNKKIPKHEKITIPINKTPVMTLKAKFLEYDEYNDTATKTIMLIFKDDATYSFYVIVEENILDFYRRYMAFISVIPVCVGAAYKLDGFLLVNDVCVYVLDLDKSVPGISVVRTHIEEG